MKPLLVHPDPAPPELAQALDLAGIGWKAVADVDAAIHDQPDAGWAGAVVVVDTDPEAAFRVCRTLRTGNLDVRPLLLLITGTHLVELSGREDLYDDFCLTPFHPRELDTRLGRLLWQSGRGPQADIIEYGPLAMNLETYQAAIEGHPLDLTYMEYELLRFLAAQPGKVFSRETLLNRVWGYDYYGGARTVDVHVRRLRSKLGEEHANLIQTIRSVGYSFGQSRWRA